MMEPFGTQATLGPAATPLSQLGDMRVPVLHETTRTRPAAGCFLAPEWNELAQRLAALPYLQLGWAQAWWQAFGQGEPQLHSVRRAGRLAAVAPLTRRNGLLESTANYHTPHFGLLAEDYPASLALAAALFADQPTHVSLSALDPDGESLRACRQAAADAGYRVVLRPFQRSLYLQLKGEWREYELRLGRNLLRNLKRARRQLQAQGVLDLDIVTGGAELERHLQEAFILEASGWKGATGTAIQSDARTRRFYTALARWAADRGILRLFFLRVGGRPLAMYFALQEHGACHLLKGGYDAGFGRYSPGSLLMHMTLHTCFASGLSRVEFNGDAEPYKFSWATTLREYQRFDAFAPTMAGQLSWAAFTYNRSVTSRLRQQLKFSH